MNAVVISQSPFTVRYSCGNKSKDVVYGVHLLPQEIIRESELITFDEPTVVFNVKDIVPTWTVILHYADKTEIEEGLTKEEASRLINTACFNNRDSVNFSCFSDRH